MTQLTIATETPLSEVARALVDGSEAALREVYSPEECFSFTAEKLVAPEISFYVARKEAVAVGCVALVACDGYGEIKRLYVPHSARGLGVGKALMDHLEADAVARNISCVRLETGDKLEAAVAIYKARGYLVCGPFGDYEAIDASLFMEKVL